MIYLSRCVVHKQEAIRAKLKDSYAWHKELWKAFPGRDGSPRDFLFRVEDRHPSFQVLILSPASPEHLSWGHWQTKEVSSGFLNRDQYRFQMKANPTMRRKEDRRRLGIYAEDRLRAWMHRKADLNGFSVEDRLLDIGAPVDETFVRDKRRGKHVAVEFRGCLQVVDRNAFHTAFHHGIGSAKSFGFGLLMLQPIT